VFDVLVLYLAGDLINRLPCQEPVGFLPTQLKEAVGDELAGQAYCQPHWLGGTAALRVFHNNTGRRWPQDHLLLLFCLTGCSYGPLNRFDGDRSGCAASLPPTKHYSLYTPMRDTWLPKGCNVKSNK